ncbi:MAG: hypothetical protein P1V51_11845 [Deltaproteobacteria bacterium]|nr:hypothetical protein [Deltaproteobacteria bacterium]
MKWRYVLLAAVLVVQIPLLHQACWSAPPASQSLPFADDFERAELGPAYGTFFHAARPKIEAGRLWTGEVKNNPIWLDLELPEDVVVTFDVQATARAGDVKWELFGNGRDHESGYVFVFGGWTNTISIIARLDEHGSDRKERKDFRVDPARVYQMRVERKAGHLKWYVDGTLFLEWKDESPLTGTGHDRFGFSAWETPAYFDNLRIEAL